MNKINKMKYRGINYDVGTITLTGGLTRDIFDPDVVSKEIQIIKMNCIVMHSEINSWYI